jgi:hypothetical protein
MGFFSFNFIQFHFFILTFSKFGLLAITKMERLEKQWQCQEMERQKIQDKI